MSDSQLSTESVEAVYAPLNQQQRTTLADEFVRGFRRAEASHEEPFTSVDLKKVTLQQLTAMHQHARDEHPDVLGRVMRSPIVSALLGNFGKREIETYGAQR